MARVAKALTEGEINEHNIFRLQKKINNQVNAEIALLAPEVGEAMQDKLVKSSQGDKLDRDLPIPEAIQRQAKMEFGPSQTYLQTITTEGERYNNLPCEIQDEERADLARFLFTPLSET